MSLFEGSLISISTNIDSLVIMILGFILSSWIVGYMFIEKLKPLYFRKKSLQGWHHLTWRYMLRGVPLNIISIVTLYKIDLIKSRFGTLYKTFGDRSILITNVLGFETSKQHLIQITIFGCCIFLSCLFMTIIIYVIIQILYIFLILINSIFTFLFSKKDKRIVKF